MKTKILFFISFVLAILLISFVSFPKAQIVLTSQPYINSSGVAIGQVTTPSNFCVTSKACWNSSADKQYLILDNAVATGLELNVGTPALGTCTGGSLTSGSHNGAGEITGNTSGSCVLNFGTPNFTNSPFCTLNDETNLVAARVSARSASSITITGLTSGDAVQYICLGRIGT